MKKLMFVLLSLTCISSMTSCGGNSPTPEPIATKCVVDFNTNCSDQYIDPLYIDKGTVINEPVLKRDKYIYRGWYKDEEMLNPFDFSQGVQNDMVLTCKWDVDPQYMARFYFHGWGCEVNGESQFYDDINLNESAHYRIETINNSFTLPEQLQTSNEDITYTYITPHLATLDVLITDASKPYEINILCKSDEYCYVGVNMTNCKIGDSHYFIKTEKKDSYLKYEIDAAPNYRLPDHIKCLYPSSTVPSFVNYNPNGVLEITKLVRSVILEINAEYIGDTTTVCFECTNCSGRFSLEKDYKDFGVQTYEINTPVAIQLKNGASSKEIKKDNIEFSVNGVVSEDFEFNEEQLIITFRNTGNIVVKISTELIGDVKMTFEDEGFDFVINGETYTKGQEYSVVISEIYEYAIVKIEISKSDGTDLANENFKAFTTASGSPVDTLYEEHSGKGYLLVYVSENVTIKNDKESI